MIDEFCSSAYQEKLRQAKKNFLDRGDPVAPLLSPLILNSWNKCRDQALDPVNLPAVKRDAKQKTIANITPFKEYTIHQFRGLFDHLNKALDQFGAAIIFLDHELQVYHKEGNPDLLAELKKRHISFGTKFTEAEAGTNAAALTQETQEDCWVVGQQHYKEALSDYVCYSYKPIITVTGLKDYKMLLIPYSAFDMRIAALFQYIGESHSQLTNFQMLPHTALTTNVFEQYLNRNHAACVIVDSNNTVIFTNQFFQQLFKKRLSQSIGVSLSKLLPEIMPHILSENPNPKQANPTRHNIIFDSLKENRRSFIMERQPFYLNNEKVGYAFILTEKDHMAKQISQIANSGTFFTVDDIIGDSAEMLYIKEIILRSAKTDSNILITGESGTGKEMVAQSIHNASDRKNQPFISVNCAAIPQELIESELFGYTEGAFTGARKSGSPGKFELADQGTLFLDEIGDMPVNMQTVLLRALESHSVTRLGGTKPIKTDVRLITATNCNLWDLVSKNLFRMDLYFRINVVNIQTVPLRKLNADLSLLIQHFLKKLSYQYNKTMPEISAEVLHLFQTYTWPGNIRELRNLLERIMIFNDSSVIGIGDIPSDLLTRMNTSLEPFAERSGKSPSTYPEPLFNNYAAYEKQQILSLLASHKGNKSLVAQKMGISRRTLYTKIQKYEI